LGLAPERCEACLRLLPILPSTYNFVSQGSALVEAKQQAVQWIGQQVQLQASLLAYIDVFWTLMLVSLAAVPLALLLRKIKLGGPAAVTH